MRGQWETHFLSHAVHRLSSELLKTYSTTWFVAMDCLLLIRASQILPRPPTTHTLFFYTNVPKSILIPHTRVHCSSNHSNNLWRLVGKNSCSVGLLKLLNTAPSWAGGLKFAAFPREPPAATNTTRSHWLSSKPLWHMSPERRKKKDAYQPKR